MVESDRSATCVHHKNSWLYNRYCDGILEGRFLLYLSTIPVVVLEVKWAFFNLTGGKICCSRTIEGSRCTSYPLSLRGFQHLDTTLTVIEAS
ncbi:hypothetical protein BgAZ_100420 [Babesia gibsoni]|uniref:Uncharacterized protein n=1 Tax=Babesia gibsoni TaxID=33632 RepID=A0AAD8PEZ0_BABGI|nr:hypothetical protein BgAZ_100420 [Babesia gibsoni]